MMNAICRDVHIIGNKTIKKVPIVSLTTTTAAAAITTKRKRTKQILLYSYQHCYRNNECNNNNNNECSPLLIESFVRQLQEYNFQQQRLHVRQQYWFSTNTAIVANHDDNTNDSTNDLLQKKKTATTSIRRRQRPQNDIDAVERTEGTTIDDDNTKTTTTTSTSVQSRHEVTWEKNYKLLKSYVTKWQKSSKLFGTSKNNNSSNISEEEDQDDSDSLSTSETTSTTSTQLPPPIIDNEQLQSWLERQRSDIKQYIASKTVLSLSSSSSSLSTSSFNNIKYNDDIMLQRMQKLESIGYSVDPRQEHWNIMYEQLKEYIQEKKKTRKETLSPQNLSLKHNINNDNDDLLNNYLPTFNKLKTDNERILFFWCHRQKQMYRKYYNYSNHQNNQDQYLNDDNQHKDSDDSSSTNSSSSLHIDDNYDDNNITKIMIEERINKLNNINFIWNQYDTIWENMFYKLQQYYIHHGDCLVPCTYINDPKLAKWVSRQRSEYILYNKSINNIKSNTNTNTNNKNIYTTITLDRINKLNTINFEWDANDAKWNKKYTELQTHVQQVGYGNRPNENNNKSLYWFVRRQEKLYYNTTNDTNTITNEIIQNNQQQQSTTDNNNNKNHDSTSNGTSSASSSSSSLTPKRIALLRELGFLLH